ncbi:hypothetical protein A3D00_00420 [Candidatus Woesebacteria bacterium RIFCSPHIGHO2_02_FULL_38_9]|nr:MAG: hypothetical protein A3D00_00420 [Candidatus Woesebacteria bacterium RIFCSPHIGHO2_02_FULL_38_9]OGM57084.1 MAG: hypothetical protein A3A50_05475 [Candidatus Woesebacteria bacterium RIFCSPLOWO2_01_FULL_38_20]
MSSIVIPLYTILRKGMINKSLDDHIPQKFYSKQRMSKIALTNFFLLILTIILITLILLSIKSRRDLNYFSREDISIFLIYFLVVNLISYGAGMYIISIIKEQFTTKSLKNHPEYKILYLTNEYFHGPVSHVLIFSGGFTLFFLISILELFYATHEINLTKVSFYIIYGLLFGGLFLFAQLFNKTWKHQSPWMIGLFLLYLGVIYNYPVNLFFQPFNLFFITFGFILCTGLIIRHATYILRGERYKYDYKK